MANVNVTYDQMRDGAKDLRNGQQEIDSKLDELKSKINSLVNEGYVTDASSKAFDESYTEFTDGAKKLMEGLDGMAKFLEAAADAMQQTDEELAKAVRG